jgi:hypothetical protein
METEKDNFTHFQLIFLQHKTKTISKKFDSLAARAVFVGPFFIIFD